MIKVLLELFNHYIVRDLLIYIGCFLLMSLPFVVIPFVICYFWFPVNIIKVPLFCWLIFVSISAFFIGFNIIFDCFYSNR